MAQTPEENATATTKVNETLAALDTTWENVVGLDIAGADADRDQIGRDFDAYRTVVTDKLIPAGATNSYELFNQIVADEVAPVTNSIDQALTKLLDAEDAAAKASTESSATAYETARSCSSR